jgi:hypothetical protein
MVTIMNKIVFSLRAVLLIALASVGIGVGQNASANGDHSPTAQTYLFQKCTGTDASPICPTGTSIWPITSPPISYGSLTYNLWGSKFNFSFEGDGLTPKQNYTLIYWADPWPGAHSICLASGKTDKHGEIFIHGSAAGLTDGLPIVADANYTTLGPNGLTGAKIWLVRSSDVVCSPFALTWHPASILFDYSSVVYTYKP